MLEMLEISHKLPKLVLRNFYYDNTVLAASTHLIFFSTLFCSMCHTEETSKNNIVYFTETRLELDVTSC